MFSPHSLATMIRRRARSHNFKESDRYIHNKLAEIVGANEISGELILAAGEICLIAGAANVLHVGKV